MYVIGNEAMTHQNTMYWLQVGLTLIYLMQTPTTGPLKIITHFAHNTMLCYPWRHVQRENVFSNFPWKSQDRTPHEFL